MNAILIALFLSFSEFPEPPVDWLVGWSVEELPGKAGLYYDIDGDGEADLVTAHDIVNVSQIKECQEYSRNANTWTVGFDCSTYTPKAYTLSRGIISVKMVDEEWHMVMEKTFRVCTSKNYEDLTCLKWSDD